MNCHIHRAEVACGTCAHCGKFYCGDCLIDIDGRYFCRDDIKHAMAARETASQAKQPQPQQPPMVFMNAAGGAVANHKKGVNHLLHFILTMLTGVWLFVWIFIVITNRN